MACRPVRVNGGRGRPLEAPPFEKLAVVYMIVHTYFMGGNEKSSWHDRKCELNVAEHGYDFTDLEEIFDGRYVLERPDTRFDYGELRFNALVEFRGIVLNITFTPRLGKVHIISARTAGRKERKAYNEKKAGS